MKYSNNYLNLLQYTHSKRMVYDEEIQQLILLPQMKKKYLISICQVIEFKSFDDIWSYLSHEGPKLTIPHLCNILGPFLFQVDYFKMQIISYLTKTWDLQKWPVLIVSISKTRHLVFQNASQKEHEINNCKIVNTSQTSRDIMSKVVQGEVHFYARFQHENCAMQVKW